MNIAQTFFNLARPGVKFTLQDLLAELDEVYEGHVIAQATLFGCSEAKLNEALGGVAQHAVFEAYDYVTEGKLDVSDPGGNADCWLDYAALIAQAQLNAEFYPLGCPATANRLFFVMSYVRFKLDIDTYPGWQTDWAPVIFQNEGCGYLTLKEIAYVAQMTEKAVRNATQPTVVDRLITKKVGASTVVDSHEALRWLKGRRNFKPTTIVMPAEK